MKIVYIAEKEELQTLIKESIHDEIQFFLKGLNQKTIPERLSLVEAAQYLEVSKSYMYKVTHTRMIPFNKFGKRVFFYTKELDDWLKENSPRYKSKKEIEIEAIEYLSNVERKKLYRAR
jgi:excisionase family DNA binding protein